jgi:AcrR family transcriptional regulator
MDDREGPVDGEDGDRHNEGLRDRKKRMLRQQISDTATLMFLERGFDEVRVSEIAAACDVSEKTVFNYFATKEALVLDREEDQAALIIEAIRDRERDVPLVDAVVAMFEADVDRTYGEWAAFAEGPDVTVVRDVASLIDNTPALSAAWHGMLERLTDVAATELAERAGVDPDDPEPQLAAVIILGLWRTQFRAMVRHADRSRDVSEVRAAVLDDIRRAASVAAGGLSAFNLVIRTQSTKSQLLEAAEAADQARKQLVAAVKQARSAWRQITAELHHAQVEVDEKALTPRERRALHQQMRDDIRRRKREIRQEIHERQQELRRHKAALREQENAARREGANRRR